MKFLALLFSLVFSFGAPALAGEVAISWKAKFQVPVSETSYDANLFGEAVVEVVNAYRKLHRLGALRRDSTLDAMAHRHSINQARQGSMSHRSSVQGEALLAERLSKFKVAYKVAAENIAMNKVYRVVERPVSASFSGCMFTYADNKAPVPRHTYATLAESAVARWYASPGHRANMLHKSMRRHGAGFAINPSGSMCGDIYLTQNFAG